MTAYERRISDGSSDVCSSDLTDGRAGAHRISGRFRYDRRSRGIRHRYAAQAGEVGRFDFHRSAAGPCSPARYNQEPRGRQGRDVTDELNRLSALPPEEIWALLQHRPLNSLIAASQHLTLSAHGRLVTYSRKVFIPLTKLCRDVCHYCTFATTPSDVGKAYLSREEVLEIARAGDRKSTRLNSSH